MKLPILLLLFIFPFASIFSQKIQVMEIESQKPVSGVAVYNTEKTISGITDFDGIVDISKFSENEEITFQHISHVNISLTKKEILITGNRVYLMINASTLDEVVLSIAKFELRKKEI